MTDIVERLRAAPLDMNPHLKAEAAAEIERLRAALLKIEQETIDHFAVGVARKAMAISPADRGGK